MPQSPLAAKIAEKNSVQDQADNLYRQIEQLTANHTFLARKQEGATERWSLTHHLTFDPPPGGVTV